MKQKFLLTLITLLGCVNAVLAKDYAIDMSKAMSITVNELDQEKFQTKNSPYEITSSVVDGKSFSATFNNETAGGWTTGRNDWVANPEGKAINFATRAQLKKRTTVTLKFPCKGYLYVYGYGSTSDTFEQLGLENQVINVTSEKTFMPSIEDENTTVRAYQSYRLVANKGTATFYVDESNSMYFYGFCFVPVPDMAIDIKPAPYAIVNGSTLTFYHDNQYTEREGQLYSNVNSPSWRHDNSITSVVFDSSFANYTELTNMDSWFYSMTSLASVTGFENINGENLVNISNMFQDCTGLTSLDLSKFNTSNVQGMSGLFGNCTGLTSLDLSNWNTANVTSMGRMFYGCSGLRSLDVSGFNTENVRSMSEMFYGCSSLSTLDVSGFNTANVQSMGIMFYGCSGLSSLDVSGFNTANVQNMSGMFYGCSGLSSLDVSGFNTANVQSMSVMFYGCSGLSSLDVSGFNTEKVTSIASMFKGCKGLRLLDLRSFSTSSLTEATDLYAECSDYLVVYLPEEWNIDPMTRIASFEPIGDFLYNLYKDHHAVIAYLNSPVTIAGDVVVPSKVEYQGEEYRVTKVGRISYAATTEEQNVFSKITDEEYIKVTSITFEEGIEEIDDSYLGCYVHASVINIPKSVTYISPVTYRMSSCRNTYYTDPDMPNYYLSDVTFNVDKDNRVYTSVEGVLYDKAMKTLLRCPRNWTGEFIVPKGIEALAWGAFRSCNQLESVVLPDGLKKVGEEEATSGVFNECYRLAKINIPATVEYMSYNAFYTSSSSGLKEVYCYIKEPKGYDDKAMRMFMNYSKPTLYVPYGTIDKYYAADGWRLFEKIVEMPQEIEPVEEETTISFASDEIANAGDLSNTVIDDIYFCNGSYDNTEQCVVINKVTTASQMETVMDAVIGSATITENYAGMVVKVNGRGSLKVNAQTQGSSKLAVKVGNNDAETFTQTTKGDVTINYDVPEETCIYIYAVDEDNNQQGIQFMDAVTETTSEDVVKIYSITVSPDVTGMENIGQSKSIADSVRCYTIDGKPLSQPQKGMSIQKMSDGTSRKIVVQ